MTSLSACLSNIAEFFSQENPRSLIVRNVTSLCSWRVSFGWLGVFVFTCATPLSGQRRRDLLAARRLSRHELHPRCIVGSSRTRSLRRKTNRLH
ncbi:hypothetical protein NMG60_11027727 [Bertholletia excelsa]